MTIIIVIAQVRDINIVLYACRHTKYTMSNHLHISMGNISAQLSKS